MPHTLPSHCFGRGELHRLIDRAHQLARQSQGELAQNLHALRMAASTLDGQLAELAEDEPTRRRYAGVFADPHGWEQTWVESVCTVHDPADRPVTVRLAQQVLRKPPAEFLATGRFRLTLGEQTHATSDPRELGPLVAAFLDRTPGLAAGLRADLLAFVGAA